MLCGHCLRIWIPHRTSSLTCLRRAGAQQFRPQLRPNPKPSRHLSNTAPAASSVQQTPQSPPHVAISTSAAQPFSTPLTPSLNDNDAVRKEPQPPVQEVIVQSSVPAGTPLRGLALLKGQQDPLAMEDNEYPAWLWQILEKDGTEAGRLEGAGDMFSKSKKQRRLAAKRARKEALLDPSLLVPKIPIDQQTIDLPFASFMASKPGGAASAGGVGAEEATEARDDLTAAMRSRRRAKIKEDNFLRGMR